MSKLNQIQNKIKELDGGSFQKLADAYLFRKGYEHLNSIGSLYGSDKVRKGTPDSFVPLANGKYVFMEYTTQQTNLFEKLEGDLVKCFDESKTGIPVKKIQEIIFCHTSTLTTKDEEKLSEECATRGVNLNIYGMGPISQALYQKYPDLARDLLGIDVDTGQILSLDEFVSSYNKNALATPLDTTFYFREKELADAMSALENTDLLLISGRPGIGKSRFALECCRLFSERNHKTVVKCIFSKGYDMFQDLRVHFADDGQYILFVDDANRVSRVEYALQLLHEQTATKKIKIVATVRDYAIDKLKERAKPYGGGFEVTLETFKDELIKKLVEETKGIKNYLYQERISNISKGNARLAIMAASLAVKENSLESIRDVSALYDEYFASIRSEVFEVDKIDLLKTAALVTFFRFIDFKDEKALEKIETLFGINPSRLKEAAFRLHDLEILDMYEEQLIKIADQILATYLFYLACFKEKVLDFSIFLEYFFPDQQKRFVDSLYPVLNVFYGEPLLSELRTAVDTVWEKVDKSDDSRKMFSLMETFYFLKKTDTLIYLKEIIEKIPAETGAETSSEEKDVDSEFVSQSVLKIITLFKSFDLDTFRIALDLIIQYLQKRPSKLSAVKSILTDKFGFNRFSYVDDFLFEREVIVKLIEVTQNGGNPLFTGLFLEVSRFYLHTEFSSTESKGGPEFTWYKFELPASSHIFEIRFLIWKKLFDLYNVESMKGLVLDLIREYVTHHYYLSVKKIIEKDAELLLPFLLSVLDKDNFGHCKIANEYFDFLKDSDVPIDLELQKKFKNETIEISELLLEDRLSTKDINPTYEEYIAYRKKRIDGFLVAYDFKQLVLFIDKCSLIHADLKEGHAKYQFGEGFDYALAAIQELYPSMFRDVLRYYLSLDDPFEINSYSVVDRLLMGIGQEATFSFISSQSFSTRTKWLFSYYYGLKKEQIDSKVAQELILLYQQAGESEMPHHIDFLLNYEHVDKEIVSNIVSIVLDKAELKPNYLHTISMLFNPYTDLCKKLLNVFEDKLNLLKRAYFSVLAFEDHADHDRQVLALILTVDRNFIIEYIDWKYSRKKWLSRHDDLPNYGFLWLRSDFKDVMKLIVKHVYRKEQENQSMWSSYLEAFFIVPNDDKNRETILKNQTELLLEIISESSKDIRFMSFIFSLVAELDSEHRRICLTRFLNGNKNFDDFSKLPLEASSWSGHGSWVPVIQKRIEYMESLLPLVNTAELLLHKQAIERHIQDLQNRVEYEKKRDFIDEW